MRGEAVRAVKEGTREERPFVEPSSRRRIVSTTLTEGRAGFASWSSIFRRSIDIHATSTTRLILLYVTDSFLSPFAEPASFYAEATFTTALGSFHPLSHISCFKTRCLTCERWAGTSVSASLRDR
jgi:hypothetical protein